VEASAAGGGNRGSNFECDFTDEDEDGDGEDDDEDDEEKRRRNSRGSQTSSSGGCAPVIEVGVHQDLKLVKRIAEGRRAGVDMWTAVIGGGRCRHHVAVKKAVITEGMDLDWMLVKLEDLRRASMWCRNVCTFHGAMKVDESLCLVMDKCYGSVRSEMQRNEGRLTLEQVLRFLEFSFLFD
jgi:E3 ubiquitin-protein ligase KEG